MKKEPKTLKAVRQALKNHANSQITLVELTAYKFPISRDSYHTRKLILNIASRGHNWKRLQELLFRVYMYGDNIYSSHFRQDRVLINEAVYIFNESLPKKFSDLAILPVKVTL